MQDNNGNMQDNNGIMQEGSGTVQDNNGSVQVGNGSVQEGSGSVQEGSGSEQDNESSGQDIGYIVFHAIDRAWDGLSIEGDYWVEYITDTESNCEDRPGIYRIQMTFDQDYIFAEKVEQIVGLIVEAVGMEPDKWTYDGTGEARIYWLDERAEEMEEKFGVTRH